ncbi:MAG: hypothetical protein WCP24_02390 [bacterium]
MSLPVEVQQITPLHSVTLNPVVDAIFRAFSNVANYDWGEAIQNFWLLLPDYLVAIMVRVFSFSFILSLLLLFVIIYSANNLMRIRRKMHEALALPNQEVIPEADSMPEIVNEKWQNVLVHINSSNQSDWKLAILECDIMLSEILEKMGYMQESIGEKLKSIEPSDFTNIEAAWEAHKIRNAIAHEGSDFLINEREAKRVIGLYELVFREFEYI